MFNDANGMVLLLLDGKILLLWENFIIIYFY